MQTEKDFIALLLRDDEELDKPEVAERFAIFLINEKRYAVAKEIVKTALLEGPRFDLYELRAMSNLTNLEKLWKELHVYLDLPLTVYGGEIYNEGLRVKSPSWKDVLKNLTLI